MKQHGTGSIPAWVAAAWLSTLVACTPAAVDESAPDNPRGAAPAPAGAAADAQPTDIIDRILSPLDDAVTDINRDLNKGETDTATPVDE